MGWGKSIPGKDPGDGVKVKVAGSNPGKNWPFKSDEWRIKTRGVKGGSKSRSVWRPDFLLRSLPFPWSDCQNFSNAQSELIWLVCVVFFSLFYCLTNSSQRREKTHAKFQPHFSETGLIYPLLKSVECPVLQQVLYIHMFCFHSSKFEGSSFSGKKRSSFSGGKMTFKNSDKGCKNIFWLKIFFFTYPQ